jgi:hypothetical protein
MMADSYRLPATGYRPDVSGCELWAVSCWLLYRPWGVLHS